MSVVSGIMGANAQEDAADQNTATADKGMALQEKLYNSEIERNKPFYDTGVEANARLNAMVTGKPQSYADSRRRLSDMDAMNLSEGEKTASGFNFGDPQKAWYRDENGELTDKVPLSTVAGGYNMGESPAAQYQLTQGTKSLNRQLSARGLLGSGNASQRLAELSSGIAANDYNQQYSRLLDQVKIGTGASAAAGASSSTLSNAIGQNSAAVQQNNTQAGAARASLYSGIGGSGVSAVNTGINAYRSGLFNSAGGTTYDAGGANFAGNAAGSGAVDNYGDPVGL